MNAKNIIFSVCIASFTTFSILTWIKVMLLTGIKTHNFWLYSSLGLCFLGGCLAGYGLSMIVIGIIKNIKNIEIE